MEEQEVKPTRRTRTPKITLVSEAVAPVVEHKDEPLVTTYPTQEQVIVHGGRKLRKVKVRDLVDGAIYRYEAV